MPKRSLVKPLVSVVALAGVAWWASRQRRPTPPHDRATIVALVASLALYAVATLARGERWHRILRLTGTPSRRRTAYEITTVGYMANNALPARAGDLLKAYLTEERSHV